MDHRRPRLSGPVAVRRYLPAELENRLPGEAGVRLRGLAQSTEQTAHVLMVEVGELRRDLGEALGVLLDRAFEDAAEALR